MTPLFKKLNFKDHPHIVCVNAPESFRAELQAMSEVTEVMTDPLGIDAIEFFIAFATKQNEVDSLAQHLATKLKGDAVVWMCYPKGSSKNYVCEFNRDTGWVELGKIGLEPVRQVAIDADWSALRFRRVEYDAGFCHDGGRKEKGWKVRG